MHGRRGRPESVVTTEGRITGTAGDMPRKEDSMAREGLQVHMFSAYSMEFDGEPVNIMRGISTKVLQVFAMLLLAGSKGAAKGELISHVYGQGPDRGADPNRKLNNLLYRLKKQLADWGMEGATISLEGGFARFDADFPVEVDALTFEQKAEEALSQTGSGQAELLEDAMQRYTGEFLEEYCTELWVIQKDQELKRLYARVVEKLAEVCRNEGNLMKAREVYHNAALVFPFDSWQLYEMDCLIDMKDYSGAYTVYQDTERIYDEELGIMPSEEYRSRLEIIERNSLRPVRRLSDIIDSLRGEPKEGAYYCYYPDFLDSCQILSRIAERTGQSLYLLLCTWSVREGTRTRLEKRKLEEQQMAILKDTIISVFRKGDFFTKYSRCQYLLILSGTGRENGARAFDRLYRAWKKRDGIVGDLSYSMDSLLSFREPEGNLHDGSGGR